MRRVLKVIWLSGYRMGLGLYRCAIWLAAGLGNTKAQLWRQGRRDWQQQLAAMHFTEPVLWLHAASLGEFEQGRPVLEALRGLYPQVPVVVTFFSPSGYEQRKDYPCAGVYYLPLDGPRTARRFLQYVPVRLAVFVKYDFWYYYLSALKVRGTPVLLLAACLTPRSAVLRAWLRPLYKPLIHSYSHIFCQDSRTADLLRTRLDYSATTVCGDPRFDRVQQVAANAQPIVPIEAFLQGRWAIVAGSTYPVCEALLQSALTAYWPRDMALIIAPHEVSARRVQQIMERWPGIAVRWSQWQRGGGALPVQPAARILVVDTVGLLARLYRYGRLNYVGGALEKGGIHNILESAVYGVHTLYGPYHEKSPEAAALLAAGGATEVRQAGTWVQAIREAEQLSPVHVAKGERALKFIRRGGGATQAVVQWVSRRQLL
ncbi:MAG: 3-deoxy-D-manno-octulosonic acid transferase [Bacteroidetes bacterium]|nr:3-deoxy-D-manno-octulosonic acid transferase [Bacteroidota bacterium]